MVAVGSGRNGEDRGDNGSNNRLGNCVGKKVGAMGQEKPADYIFIGVACGLLRNSSGGESTIWDRDYAGRTLCLSGTGAIFADSDVDTEPDESKIAVGRVGSHHNTHDTNGGTNGPDGQICRAAEATKRFIPKD